MYDAKNNSDFWKAFMRIRVLVYVRQSLERWKKIKMLEGGSLVKSGSNMSVWVQTAICVGSLDIWMSTVIFCLPRVMIMGLVDRGIDWSRDKEV